MVEERRTTFVGPHSVHSLHIGSGPPLVLLHGLSGSHRWWRHNVAALPVERTS